MVGIQRGSFEFILSLLYLEIPVLLADDVELTDQFVVIDKVIRIDI